MTPQEEQHLVYEIASRMAQTHGLELVEVKIGRHKKDVLIQILTEQASWSSNDMKIEFIGLPATSLKI